MKFWIVALLVVGSVSVWSQQNPQIRVCNINNGYFWSLDIEVPVPDNIGFCRFDTAQGTPLMGSLTLMEYFWQGRNTYAMSAFLKTKNYNFQSCREAGATQIKGLDSNGVAWMLCQFADNSYISELALIKGWNSPFNRRMTISINNSL